MFIVSIPIILILFVVIGLGAGIWNANIMPIVTIISLLSAIISIILCFREEKNRLIPIIVAIISIIVFFCTIGGTMTTGDIISWIWYHI